MMLRPPLAFYFALVAFARAPCVKMGLTWSTEPKTTHKSFYELTCKAIDGTDFNFADLKGDVVMITNVASA